jgi:hypothetical protein
MEQNQLTGLPAVPACHMFHSMRNGATRGTALAHPAIACIRRRLPAGWSALDRIGARRAGVLTLRAADGRSAALALVSRKALIPRDVPAVVAGVGENAIVVSHYLGERTRELLAQAGVSYADATGNLRVVVSSPAIFLEGLGAAQDPERKPRTLHSLRGPAAARVVRALSEFRPPYGVRTLAEVSATPLGTVSRVVSFLEAEALLTRDERKRIIAVDWVALLSRWSKDYGVSKSNIMRSYLEPRGLPALWPKLASLGRSAVTGSMAGTSIAPTRLAMVYVENAEAAAQALDLVPTEVGANVWLLEPYDDVVFERVRRKSVTLAGAALEFVAVALPQAAVDLMTSPGRGPQEAEALLVQMKGSVDDWRRRPRS